MAQKESAERLAQILFAEVGTADPEPAPEIAANRGLFADTGDTGEDEHRFGNQLW